MYRFMYNFCKRCKTFGGCALCILRFSTTSLSFMAASQLAKSRLLKSKKRNQKIEIRSIIQVTRRQIAFCFLVYFLTLDVKNTPRYSQTYIDPQSREARHQKIREKLGIFRRMDKVQKYITNVNASTRRVHTFFEIAPPLDGV